MPRLRQRQRGPVRRREAAPAGGQAGDALRLERLHLRRGGHHRREAGLPHGAEERPPRPHQGVRRQASRASSTPPIDPTPTTIRCGTTRRDCAFPCATQNEINEQGRRRTCSGTACYVVSEGANMPTTLDGVEVFPRRRHPLRARQGRQRRRRGHLRPGDVAEQHAAGWTREEVDNRLHQIMKASTRPASNGRASTARRATT